MRKIILGLLLFCIPAHASFFVPDGSVTSAKIANLTIIGGNIASQTITADKLVLFSVGPAQIVPKNTVVSSSSGSFSTSSNSFVDVTNLSVTISITAGTGRPVVCFLQTVTSTTGAYLGSAQNSATSTNSTFQLLSSNGGGSVLCRQNIDTNAPSGNLLIRVPLSSFYCYDPSPATTTTYKLQAEAGSGSTALVQDATLRCVEE